ncbi:MAG: UbiX family flavin prenyltransferase [Thermoanaerobaculia bacterium]
MPPLAEARVEHRLALLVTGASGMALPKAVLTAMVRSSEVERVHLVVSRGASQVLQHELSRSSTGAGDLIDAAKLTESESGKVSVHRDNELDAAISSGSYRLSGTAVIPCSAGTLGALATGSAGTLIHRAGAVALKEQWPLVLGFRETPLTTIHLENLRRLAYLRAVILPPVPAFYVGGEDFNRFLDHYVLRVLDHLGLHEPGAEGLRWGDPQQG